MVEQNFENRVIILETKIDTLNEKVQDIKSQLAKLPTKDDISRLIMEHAYKCPMITKEDFDGLCEKWYKNYQKQNIESFNLKSSFVKNIYWLVQTVVYVIATLVIVGLYK